MTTPTEHITPDPTTTSPLDAAPPRWATGRRWAIRVIYGFLSILALLQAHGLATMIFANDTTAGHFATAAVTPFKLLAVGAVIVIAWTAGDSVAAFWALVVGQSAWLMSALLFANQPPGSTPVLTTIFVAVVWFGPVVLLRPDRRELLRLDLRFGVIVLPLAWIAAVPLVAYAVQQGNLAVSDEGLGAVHYDMCSLGVVVAAQAIYAGLRPRGLVWPARCVAVAAGMIGAFAVAWPDDLASPGRPAGTALLLWALVFAGAAEFERRRSN